MVARVEFSMTVKWICSVHVFLTKLSLDFLSKEICKTLGGCPMPCFIKMCQCSNLTECLCVEPFSYDCSFFFLVMVVYCRQIYFFLAIFLTCIYCWGLMAGSNVPFLLGRFCKNFQSLLNNFYMSTWMSAYEEKN